MAESNVIKAQQHPPIRRSMMITANVGLTDINTLTRGLDTLIKRIDHAHGAFDIHVAIAVNPNGRDTGAEGAHSAPQIIAVQASEIVWDDDGTGITEDDEGFTS